MTRYRLQAKGPTRAELRIYGDIGGAWDAEESIDARSVAEAIAERSGPLDVRINSFGGSVADGLAIFNALRRYPGEVITHIDGVAYSIASLIAMAGREVRMADNGMLMIHAPWGMAVGNAPEMREMADILDKHAEAMLASYLRPNGPDAATVRGWLTDGADHYFTAAEAAEFGLVDRVTESAPLFDIAASLRGTRFTLPAATAAYPPEAVMANTPATPAAPETTAAPEPATEVLAKHSRTVKAAQAAGVKAEATRRSAISEVFSDFYTADPLDPITALHDECMEDTACDELAARRKLLAMLAAKTDAPILASEQYAMEAAPPPPPRASRHLGGAMQLGADQVDKRVKGLRTALEIKSGIERDKGVIDGERHSEFLAMSLVEMMAREMRAAGMPVGGTRESITRAYIQSLPILASGGPSHGTDHLTNILADVANKSALQGWEGAEETWSQWTIPGTLSDYREAQRANMALLDKLDKMQEHQPWSYGDLADIKQGIQGYFYGKRYGLSIQAIVNDDLGELTRAFNAWGEAASATVGDAVVAVLTAAGSGGYGQVMDEDSDPLFHSDHGNYIAGGSGAAPSITTLAAGRKAMMTATDQNGRTLGIRPRYIIHGGTLTPTVWTLLNSQTLIDGSATATQGDRNWAANMGLQSVEEYRLDGLFSGVAWILAAARRTVEVAGVGGPLVPRVERTMISETPGIGYEMSMPFGCAALDYRGLYFNDGN